MRQVYRDLLTLFVLGLLLFVGFILVRHLITAYLPRPVQPVVGPGLPLTGPR